MERFKMADGEVEHRLVAQALEDREAPQRSRLTVPLIALAVGLFAISGWSVIEAPFGDSHDGRNAGVWATGSRSLLEDGPIVSRLGTRSAASGVYANHPPLIYLETALTETLGAHSKAATRAPAWLGSLAAVGLLALLLKERGVRPGPVGAAVALTVATPMFLTFGTMLDTPVTSLPFGIGLLLVWERARNGAPVRPRTAALLVFLAALAGWQALVTSAIVGAWALIRLRQGRGSWNLNAAFAGGALGGFVALMSWLLWAFGGTLRPLLDQFRTRTGQMPQHVDLGRLLETQRSHLTSMFGLALLLCALAGLVLALRSRPTRGLAAITLAVTLPYPLVFKTGAINHHYWNYWFLLPLAIGLAVGADRLTGVLQRSRPDAEPLVAGIAGALAVALAVGFWASPPAARWSVDRGLPAGRLVESVRLGPTQQFAWYTGAVGAPASYLSLHTRRLSVAVRVRELETLAATNPEDLMLVGRVDCVTGEPVTRYTFERVSAVAARPPATGCG